MHIRFRLSYHIFIINSYKLQIVKMRTIRIFIVYRFSWLVHRWNFIYHPNFSPWKRSTRFPRKSTSWITIPVVITMTSLVWFNVKISRESNRVHGWWYDGSFRENNLVKIYKFLGSTWFHLINSMNCNTSLVMNEEMNFIQDSIYKKIQMLILLIEKKYSIIIKVFSCTTVIRNFEK